MPFPDLFIVSDIKKGEIRKRKINEKRMDIENLYVTNIDLLSREQITTATEKRTKNEMEIKKLRIWDVHGRNTGNNSIFNRVVR